PWTAEHTTSVSLLDPSKDGSRVAYGVRQGGEDEQVIRILDVASRKDLAEVLPRVRYSGVSFTGDGRGLYYSRLTKEGPRVFFHALGSDAASDPKVFGDGYGPEKIIGAGVSDDYRLLVI